MDYSKVEPTFVVDILGSEYKLFLNVPEEEDVKLKECSGYCDKTSKRIVVSARPDECDLDDWDVYAKACVRHELVHAFFFESGLNGNSYWYRVTDEHPEQLVEWIAVQFPKMLKVFEEVGAL